MKEKDFVYSLVYAAAVTLVALIGFMIAISYVTDSKVDQMKEQSHLLGFSWMHEPFYYLYSNYVPAGDNTMRGVFMQGFFSKDGVEEKVRNGYEYRDRRLNEIKPLKLPTFMTVSCSKDLDCLVVEDSVGLEQTTLVDVSASCKDGPADSLECDFTISKSLSSPNTDIFRMKSELYNDSLLITREVNDNFKDFLGEMIDFKQRIDSLELSFSDKMGGALEDLMVENVEKMTKLGLLLGLLRQFIDSYNDEYIQIELNKRNGDIFSDGTKNLNSHVESMLKEVERLYPQLEGRASETFFGEGIDSVFSPDSGFFRRESQRLIMNTNLLQSINSVVNDMRINLQRRQVGLIYENRYADESPESKSIRLRMIYDFEKAKLEGIQ